MRASGEGFYGPRFSKYNTSGHKQQIDEDIHDLAMGRKALDFGAPFRYLPLKVHLIWQEGSPVAAGQPPTPPSICRDAEGHRQDDSLSIFASVRQRLFGIAYRMLGSAAEAEDVVQDVWLRWQQSANRKTVENPPAYLATTTTRLCINVAQSAHSRRETYVGIWLPEPVDTSTDPGIGAERGEALKLAVLLLLEKLSPTERAAYVLREAFDYPYDEIASILKMEEANVRQLFSRARKHIADGHRASVSSSEQQRFLEAFVAAAQKGEMTALEGIFAECFKPYNAHCVPEPRLCAVSWLI